MQTNAAVRLIAVVVMLLTLGSVNASGGFAGKSGASGTALAQDEQPSPEFPPGLVVLKCWVPFPTVPDYYVISLHVGSRPMYRDPFVYVKALADDNMRDIPPTSGQFGMPSNPYAGAGKWAWWGEGSVSMWRAIVDVTYTNMETGQRETQLFQVWCPLKPSGEDAPVFPDLEIDFF